MDRAGVELASIAVVGGGARSRFWMQLLARVLGLPVVRYRGSETGPAFGAARLARMALTRGTGVEVCGKPPVWTCWSRSRASPLTVERFNAYRALYRALKPEFQSGRQALLEGQQSRGRA